MKRDYDDIIDLPHRVSAKHPQMSAAARAAQFAPFAALTGLGAAMDETGRRTEKKAELDEHELAALGVKLGMLLERIAQRPAARITRFVPDERKAGGRYDTVILRIKRIDEVNRVLVAEDGSTVLIDDITAIDIQPF